MEERIGDIKGRNLEMMQREEEKDMSMKKNERTIWLHEKAI